MRIAAIALFLGCSALAYEFAVQPPSTSTDSPSLAGSPASPYSLVDRLSMLLRYRVPDPPPPPFAAVNRPSPILLLSKTEALTLIAVSAAKYQVPAPFVASIVAAESNFNCAAISPKGAIGLMQLMPGTAQEYGADPSNPAENIDAGTRYLSWLMKRYEKKQSSMTHVIAAYNAGPGMVDHYHGIPPFRETRNYVTRVLWYFKHFSTPAKPQPLKS